MTTLFYPSGGASTATQTVQFSGTPSPPPSYTLYSQTHSYSQPTASPAANFVWYPHPPVMNSMASFSTVHGSIAKDMDLISSPPDDPPSSSASPNSSHHSQILGAPGTSMSPSATTEGRVNTPSVPAACLACVSLILFLPPHLLCMRVRSLESHKSLTDTALHDSAANISSAMVKLLALAVPVLPLSASTSPLVAAIKDLVAELLTIPISDMPRRRPETLLHPAPTVRCCSPRPR